MERKKQTLNENFFQMQLILASLLIYGLATKPFMQQVFIISLMIMVALLTKILKPKRFEPLFLTFYLLISFILVAKFSWEHGQKIFTKQFFNHLPQISQTIFWDSFLILIVSCIFATQVYYYIKWLKIDYLTKVKTPSADGVG